MAHGFDSDVPSPARMYDYDLGGRDNFAADREAAEAVIASHPEQRQLARNRAFLVRAVEHLAAAGITQFVDVGTGIPTSPTVLEVARRTHPDTRVVDVDDDPVVLAHARALLAEDTALAVVDADMHDPDVITEHPDVAWLIDFAYARTPRGGHLRSRAEIEAVFPGFELVEPGVVDVCRWRSFERPTHVSILAGVARRVDDGRHGDGRADGTPPPT